MNKKVRISASDVADVRNRNKWIRLKYTILYKYYLEPTENGKDYILTEKYRLSLFLLMFPIFVLVGIGKTIVEYVGEAKMFISESCIEGDKYRGSAEKWGPIYERRTKK